MQPNTVEKTVGWLGETWGFWIQTGARLLSAIGALWIVLSRARSERKRATVDLMLHQTQDKELMEAKKKILELHENGKPNFAQFLQDRNSPEYSTIIKILNNHEFVAAGIRQRAYTEKLYKHMRYSATMRDYRACAGFIAEFRLQKSAPTIWQEFEWLAQRWAKKPLKRIKQ